MRHALITYLSVGLIILTTPAIASAEPTDCVVPQAITTPCSGVLLPTDAAEAGLRCLRVDVPRLTLELEYQKNLFESQKNYYTLILSAEQKRSAGLSAQIDVLIAKPLPKKSAFDSPAFWTVLGMFIGAGAAIGIAHSLPR